MLADPLINSTNMVERSSLKSQVSEGDDWQTPKGGQVVNMLLNQLMLDIFIWESVRIRGTAHLAPVPLSFFSRAGCCCKPGILLQLRLYWAALQQV